MIQVDEAALHAFLQKYLKTGYAHVLQPFYQGYVTGSDPVAAPGQAQIQPIGESAPDPTLHAVLGTGYLPRVGDRVQLARIDDKLSVILGPVSTPSLSPVKIDDQYVAVGNTAASIVIPPNGVALPRGYSKLRISGSCRSTSAGATDFIYMRFNGDGSGAYNTHTLVTSGATAPTSQDTLAANQLRVGFCDGAGSGAGQMGTGWIEIMDYDQNQVRVGFTSQFFYTGVGFGALDINGGHYGPGALANIASIALLPGAGSWAPGTHFVTYADP